MVQGYKAAIGKGDVNSARKYLRDDLSFQGPFDTVHSPEPYLEAFKKLSSIVKRVEVKKTFVDGNDVCLLYDMVTDTPVGTSFIVEWLQVKGDKIASIRVVFDARLRGRPCSRNSRALTLRGCGATRNLTPAICGPKSYPSIVLLHPRNISRESVA